MSNFFIAGKLSYFQKKIFEIFEKTRISFPFFLRLLTWGPRKIEDFMGRGGDDEISEVLHRRTKQ